MREPEGTLIRFVGVLREDHRFIHIPAWETPTVFERPDEGDGSYVVDLTDGGDRVLSRTSPRIEFRDIEEPDATGLRLADVLVYVPMHPEARQLVFRRLEPGLLEIFRTELAERPPAVGDLVVERGRRGTLRLRWTVKHDRPTTSTVFLVRERLPALVIASGLGEPVLDIDAKTLPGPQGRIAVSATDGFRSSSVVGPVVDGLSTEIRLQITAPEADSTLPPDQPVTLIATALDAAGTQVRVEGVSWQVDGKPGPEGQVSVAPPLEPGGHTIEVKSPADGAPMTPAAIKVRIAKRSEDQEAFAKLVADLPPIAERMRDIEG